MHDKSVLVTGAGRGIGKRLAMGFARAGARVVLLARSKPELELAQLEIEHAGGIAMRIRADVRDYSAMQAAAEEMRQREFFPLHTLVCAAGVPGPIGPVEECDPREWADAIQVNLIGVMNAIHAVLPSMKQKRAGKIILLAGAGAESPRANFSAYAAAKAAVARLAETLAEEVRESNIQVNCLSPGSTYTSMTDEILASAERAGERELTEAAQVRTTGGASPDKQIQLALFLASDRSNHISGKIIHLDDDWKKLEHSSLKPGYFTLRRVERI